jgi:hypothetical protein
MEKSLGKLMLPEGVSPVDNSFSFFMRGPACSSDAALWIQICLAASSISKPILVSNLYLFIYLSIYLSIHPSSSMSMPTSIAISTSIWLSTYNTNVQWQTRPEACPPQGISSLHGTFGSGSWLGKLYTFPSLNFLHYHTCYVARQQ